MRYLVSYLTEAKGKRKIAALARELGLFRSRLSDIMHGKRGLVKAEAIKILERHPEWREAVIASLLDEDMDHRNDYNRLFSMCEDDCSPMAEVQQRDPVLT